MSERKEEKLVEKHEAPKPGAHSYRICGPSVTITSSSSKVSHYTSSPLYPFYVASYPFFPEEMFLACAAHMFILNLPPYTVLDTHTYQQQAWSRVRPRSRRPHSRVRLPARP